MEYAELVHVVFTDDIRPICQNLPPNVKHIREDNFKNPVNSIVSQIPNKKMDPHTCPALINEGPKLHNRFLS